MNYQTNNCNFTFCINPGETIRRMKIGHWRGWIFGLTEKKRVFFLFTFGLKGFNIPPSSSNRPGCNFCTILVWQKELCCFFQQGKNDRQNWVVRVLYLRCGGGRLGKKQILIPQWFYFHYIFIMLHIHFKKNYFVI